MVGRLTISGVLSMLVVSGKGELCNQFRLQLKQMMLATEENTGLSKTYIHKYGKLTHQEEYNKIGAEIWQEVLKPIVKEIPDHVYGSDGLVGKKRFNRKVVN